MAIISNTELITVGVQTGTASATQGNRQIAPIAGFNTIPVNTGTFSASETYENIMDQGRRGSEAMDYNSYQGVGSTEISFEFPMMFGNTYAGNGGAVTDHSGSVLGILLRNMLNTGPNAAGSGITPIKTTNLETTAGTPVVTRTWQTYFRLGNSFLTAAQTEYLTIGRTLKDGTGAFAGNAQYKDCRVTEIAISANAGEGAVTVSVTLTGQPATVSDTAAVANKTLSTHIALGWKNEQIATNTIFQPKLMGTDLYTAGEAGANTNRMISFEATLSRAATPVYGLNNTQGYNNIYLGPLEVTYNAVAQLNNTELAIVRAGRPAVGDVYDTRIAFSEGLGAQTGATATEKSMALVIGIKDSTPIEAPMEIDASGEYATVSISARALATNGNLLISNDDYDNTSDTNRSPIEIMIQEQGQNTTTSPKYQ